MKKLKFNEVFTDYIINKWGEMFELDESQISSSLDRLRMRLLLNEDHFKAHAYWSSFFVPAMLLNDIFLSDMVKTIQDDEPYTTYNGREISDENRPFIESFHGTFPTGKFIVDFNEYDETVWFEFLENAISGFKDNDKYSDKLKLLILETSVLQFELVQYVLNNIGSIIYWFYTYGYFRYYVMHAIEKYSSNLCRWYLHEWMPKYDKAAYDKFIAVLDEAVAEEEKYWNGILNGS